jgi:hypothetical protein
LSSISSLFLQPQFVPTNTGIKVHAPEADSLESCVFGLFNEIVGRMNKDISDVLRPKTSEVAEAVRTYQAAITQKTSEIGTLFAHQLYERQF